MKPTSKLALASTEKNKSTPSSSVKLEEIRRQRRFLEEQRFRQREEELRRREEMLELQQQQQQQQSKKEFEEGCDLSAEDDAQQVAEEKDENVVDATSSESKEEEEEVEVPSTPVVNIPSTPNDEEKEEAKEEAKEEEKEEDKEEEEEDNNCDGEDEKEEMNYCSHYSVSSHHSIQTAPTIVPPTATKSPIITYPTNIMTLASGTYSSAHPTKLEYFLEGTRRLEHMNDDSDGNNDSISVSVSLGSVSTMVSLGIDDDEMGDDLDQNSGGDQNEEEEQEEEEEEKEVVVDNDSIDTDVLRKSSPHHDQPNQQHSQRQEEEETPQQQKRQFQKNCDQKARRHSQESRSLYLQGRQFRRLDKHSDAIRCQIRALELVRSLQQHQPSSFSSTSGDDSSCHHDMNLEECRIEYEIAKSDLALAQARYHHKKQQQESSSSLRRCHLSSSSLSSLAYENPSLSNGSNLGEEGGVKKLLSVSEARSNLHLAAVKSLEAELSWLRGSGQNSIPPITDSDRATSKTNTTTADVVAAAGLIKKNEGRRSSSSHISILDDDTENDTGEDTDKNDKQQKEQQQQQDDEHKREAIIHVLHTLGRLYDERFGRYQDALICYNDALKLEVESARQQQQKWKMDRVNETRKKIGRLHYMLGDFRLAVRSSFTSGATTRA